MKDYGTATSSATPVPEPLSQPDSTSTIPASRKSSESANPMNVEEPSMTPASAPLAELNRKKSTESMVIDDDIAYEPAADGPYKLVLPFGNNNNYVPTSEISGTFLKTKDFNYTMQLMDDKINSLYKLCRFISDQQEKTANSLKKLVALNELSENFWNVSYFTYL
jgi:hypothetical protein